MAFCALRYPDNARAASLPPLSKSPLLTSISTSPIMTSLSKSSPPAPTPGGAMARVRGEIPTPEALGRMLQQGRLLRGMSQRDLADHLGIGQKWVWQMESGKPGLLSLIHISEPTRLGM